MLNLPLIPNPQSPNTTALPTPHTELDESSDGAALIGVPRDIEPMPRPPLAVCGRVVQPFDDRFLVRRGGR